MKEKLLDKMLAYCKKERLIDKGDRIVVGVSGGVDSVCLLQLLNEIREPWGLSLYVLHVHHGIRGEEADRDASLVEQMAEQLSLPFWLVRKNVKNLAAGTGMTEEEAGRKVRYEAFEEYRKKVGADKIAVAHHEEDQAETVLFHLFRGTGPRGLCGMLPKNGVLIRPLLGVSKQELEAFAKEHTLSYCLDRTNLLTEYTRNKMRLQVIPSIQKEINTQALCHIAMAADKIRQWRQYIEKEGERAADRILVSGEGEIHLSVERFREEDKAIQEEVLRRLFYQCIPGAKDICSIHYEQVRALIDKQAGSRLSLPQNITVVREYDTLCFNRGTEVEKEEIPHIVCNLPSRHILNCGGEKICISLHLEKREDLPLEIPQKDYTKWLDYDMIKGSLVLRGPQEGDYFILDKSGSRKKLSRYYIDQKVPSRKRGQQIVLATGKHVLWAIPGRISAAARITEETKKVLVVTKEREQG